MYYLCVNVTFNLISGLVFRMMMTGVYLILFAVEFPNLVGVNASWDGRVSRPIFGSL